MINDRIICIAGLGKMGSTVAQLALKAGYRVYAFDPSEAAIKAAGSLKNKITIETSFSALLQQKAPLILAVKPDNIDNLCSQIKDDRLIISIAAGISVTQIHKNRGVKGPDIRVMPNTPLLVKQGMTVLYAAENVSEENKNLALELFIQGGEAFFIEKEEQMHIVTGLSGSGPAFVYLFIQALEDAGVLNGLGRDMARNLAIQTVIGAAELTAKSKKSPQELIHDVTSPGGTTIRGIKALKDHSFESAVINAISRAADRSQELGDKKT